MRSTVIVYMMCLIFGLKAQDQVILGNAQKIIQTDKYRITTVIDSTENRSIGQVYTSGNTKGSFRVNNASLFRYIQRSFPSQSAKKEITLVIKKLIFKESIDEKYLVSGTFDLQLDFYISYDSELMLLYSSKGGSKYQRSIAFGFEGRLGELISQSINSSIEVFDKYVNLNYLQLECFNMGSLIDIIPFKSGRANDTLFYDSGEISWQNFKAEPTYPSRFSAAIFPSFAIKSTYTMENGLLKATIYPSVFMIESMSWVKPSALNEYSLNHEKIHFDIAYLAAQTLIKNLKEIKANTVRDLQSYIQYEYLEAYRYMNRLQDQYDDETSHGTNEQAQKRWESRISIELSATQSP